MKTVITYKDGRTATFGAGDALELDLDTDHGREIFSIVVYDAAGNIRMSAYHWHNEPPDVA